MTTPIGAPAPSLRNLLVSYRNALELANSRNSLELWVRDNAAGRVAEQEEEQHAVEIFSLSWWELPFLRYLLHRHIKTRVSAIRRAYARRAATQENPGQFSVELDALQCMNEAVPTLPSPWKLWAAYVATIVATTGVGARRSTEVFSEQDWAVMDRLRESIVRLGTIDFGTILLIGEGSAVLLLLLLASVTIAVALVLLFLRDAFRVKQVLLRGKFGVRHEGKLDGFKGIPGNPFKIPAALDPRGANVLERTLFENLGERRPTEIPLDLCSSVFGIAGYLIFWTVTVAITPPAEITLQQTLLGQISVYLADWAAFITPAIHHGVRTWRRWRARMAETPLVLDGFWKTWIRSPLFLVPLAAGFILWLIANP